MRLLPSIKRLLACVAVLSAVLLSGCASDKSGSLAGTHYGEGCARITYAGEPMKSYYFDRLSVAVCVPKSVSATRLKRTREVQSERVRFSGFAVPPGTDLESKELTVYLDRYPADLGTISLGSSAFHNVKYICTRKYEHFPGYTITHVIYSGEGPTFDFEYRVADPRARRGHRPAKYDEAAQLRLTRIIMRTYREIQVSADRIIIVCANSVQEETPRRRRSSTR